MDDLQTILNQIRNEIVNIFNGATQVNLSRVGGQFDKTVYSIDLGEATRVDSGRPIKSISIRRQIVVRIASEAKSRGLNLEEDLNNKAAFVTNLQSMIINIERNSVINELGDVANPIYYIGDDGLKELALDNDSVSWEAQIRFRTEQIHY